MSTTLINFENVNEKKINSFSHIFAQRRSSRTPLTKNDDSSGRPSYSKRKSFSSNVSTIFMRFRVLRWEWSFMKEPDLMLKYSTLMGFLVFIGILVIQATNSPYVKPMSFFFLF